jgi:UDP-N-acetylenolpyruvoylglucosamine reductase
MQQLNLNPVLPLLDVEGLRARVAGAVVTSADEAWDEARQAWNLAVDQHPVAVVLAETANDVAATIEHARAAGLRVAPQGTGHNATPLGDLSDTILLKTSRMRGVEIDPEARIARVEAGVIWIEVVRAAAEHGLAALSGSSPDVGVVGYTLGGGLSWLARKYGFAANSVTAIELVTAEGRFVRAESENEPDLFWALRGGGGSFGVVTALEFRLYPLTEVYAGVLFWPVERATEVLAAWREWIRDLPDELTSVGRILQLPPLPEIPEPLRGRSFVVVETIYAGGEAEGVELNAPLRALGPELDTVAMVPMEALSHLHMDPEFPVPGAGEGMLLDELDAAAIDALVASSVGSSLISVEVRHLGGAVGRPSPRHGAVSHFDAEFLLFGVGITPGPEAYAAALADVARLVTAMEPWDAGSMYMNFSEVDLNKGKRWSDHAHHRLRRIKARYDAGDVIRSNHPVTA